MKISLLSTGVTWFHVSKNKEIQRSKFTWFGRLRVWKNAFDSSADNSLNLVFSKLIGNCEYRLSSLYASLSKAMDLDVR
ncbi:hypothetical protein OGAPHI_005677 [Ogataea philodendri]|uniref:Uncharacterized protein n=1 Tax=Ogataea philodendri TaxID=1378263 RepID=A0A9P8NZN3_9ASCO|nr:uncharacterized protein OGAPHI_005677 [Ogataea philodendri]KAH3662425.1 hypothetical protein OGAPHI_005677 [Ogataea philodendri]